MESGDTILRSEKTRKPIRLVRVAPPRTGVDRPTPARVLALAEEANATARRILALMEREEELLDSSLRGLIETRRTLEWSNRFASERNTGDTEGERP